MIFFSTKPHLPFFSLLFNKPPIDDAINSHDVAMINKCLIHVVGFAESITTTVNNKTCQTLLGDGFCWVSGLVRRWNLPNPTMFFDTYRCLNMDLHFIWKLALHNLDTLRFIFQGAMFVFLCWFCFSKLGG